MSTLKFSANKHSDFSKTLRSRVNAYFKTHNISKHANKSMVSKTAVMLFAFFAPLILINTGIIHHTLLLFVLYTVSGLGMAGIGMGVMHDAIHGSYSKHRKVNKYLGYTMNLIGANATVWKIQHNVLHHTYTNIQHADDDINVPFFLRFSPHARRYWLHRFQHVYVWFFYSISTLMWITAKDFVRLTRYKKMGLLNREQEYKRELFKLIGWKLLYYSYALILPLIMVPLSPWIVILAFLCMHVVTGLWISSIFQVAHVMPSTEYPLADRDGVIENDWFLHQLETTSNFSPRSRFFSWLIGGLNYQVEHHLLPHICHIHYRKISHIVIETAHEYGLPYHMKKTFVSAIADHVRMLRQLGKTEMATVSS
ncbi:fatty acid desaturase family protein [Sinomicrobium weinanense]|uniref:Acyl-CoA desaturase n=1 Tax=Sinomicrobium weinanense TaxID=2842200 RepID=A0A926JPQ4_9FLAO|nr:acyl-CoA desaturase [Sinomicrobium weinanense]MBC9795059.1 acyl-CoA desaturase [Sinomicrobium weinanense]